MAKLYLILLLAMVVWTQHTSVKLQKKQAHHKHRHTKRQGQGEMQQSMSMEVNEESVELMLQKHEVYNIIFITSFFIKNFYLAEISVGSPMQNFTVLIDTGSPNLVLTSTLCQQESCHMHGAYNPQQSNTSYYIEAIKLANGEVGNEIDIQFASGSVEGVFFEDRKTSSSLESFKNLKMQKHTKNHFISYKIFSQMKFDGILGLGRIKEAVVQNASFIHNIKYDTDTKNFSLYLSSHEEDQELQSELVLGGISQHLIEPGQEFSFFQVTTEHLWTINLHAIYLGDQRIDNCDQIQCYALVDSGTSFVSFASYPMDIFFERFGVYQPCNRIDGFPDLKFVFDNGITFSLSGNQYFKRNNHSMFSKDICIPFVKASPVLSEYEQLFVLGQPFLIRHYVWFDEQQSRIGIVKSRQTN